MIKMIKFLLKHPQDSVILRSKLTRFKGTKIRCKIWKNSEIIALDHHIGIKLHKVSSKLSKRLALWIKISLISHTAFIQKLFQICDLLIIKSLESRRPQTSPFKHSDTLS